LEINLDVLPFLHSAIQRLLQEYPSITHGLGRTERQVLDAVADGARSFDEIFASTQSREERPFMGDQTVWSRILPLARGTSPALSLESSDPPHSLTKGHLPRVSLAPSGDAYRTGDADFVRRNGIDRWIGGVHLEGQECDWRWDPDRGVRNFPT
ncbi:MAG: hypothetical protein ABI679_12945, partial [Gemmatimonadota bacterium]